MKFKLKDNRVTSEGVTAIQFTGSNHNEIQQFTEGRAFLGAGFEVRVNTPEGIITVENSDYVIRMPWGQFYPITKGLFDVLFEPNT